MPPARGKTLKVGVSSSPLFAAGAGDSSGRVAEPPLEVLYISVRSLASQGAELPPPIPKYIGRGRFGVEGDENSLLSHGKLAAGVVSSILRDSNLKKVETLFVEEALALLLKGVASVCPSAFTGLFPHCFRLLANLLFFFGWWLLT